MTCLICFFLNVLASCSYLGNGQMVARLAALGALDAEGTVHEGNFAVCCA